MAKGNGIFFHHSILVGQGQKIQAGAGGQAVQDVHALVLLIFP